MSVEFEELMRFIRFYYWYNRQIRMYDKHAFHARAGSDFFHFEILAALRENIAMYKTVADLQILFTEV